MKLLHLIKTLKYRFDNRYYFETDSNHSIIVIDKFQGTFGEDFIVYNSNL